MEITLEQAEVEALLRAALREERSLAVPDDAIMVIRQNHKKRTIRIVFQTHTSQENLKSPRRRKSLRSTEPLPEPLPSTVHCPKCNVAQGEDCLGRRGQARTSFHRERWELGRESKLNLKVTEST